MAPKEGEGGGFAAELRRAAAEPGAGPDAPGLAAQPPPEPVRPPEAEGDMAGGPPEPATPAASPAPESPSAGVFLNGLFLPAQAGTGPAAAVALPGTPGYGAPGGVGKREDPGTAPSADPVPAGGGAGLVPVAAGAGRRVSPASADLAWSGAVSAGPARGGPARIGPVPAGAAPAGSAGGPWQAPDAAVAGAPGDRDLVVAAGANRPAPAPPGAPADQPGLPVATPLPDTPPGIPDQRPDPARPVDAAGLPSASTQPDHPPGEVAPAAEEPVPHPSSGVTQAGSAPAEAGPAVPERPNPAATAIAGAAATAPAPAPTPHAEAPAPPPPPRPAPPAPVRQLAPVAIALALGPGQAPRLTVALEPEELGRVEIRVERGAGESGTAVQVIAERPETLALLQRDARELDRALQGAGIAVEAGGLRFSLSGEGRGAGDGGQPEPGGDGRSPRRASPAALPSLAAAPPPPAAAGLSLLDIAV